MAMSMQSADYSLFQDPLPVQAQAKIEREAFSLFHDDEESDEADDADDHRTRQ